MEVHRIWQSDDNYPKQITRRMGDAAPEALIAAGNLDILRNPGIGLICSIKCPGSIIIRTFDTIRRLREEMVVMIGGFHSPMEHECLDLLLRGSQPVILCPARSLRNLRIGEKARKALKDGRLLILTCFDDEVRRTTLSQALLRNDMVAAMSEAILVPHASKNGKTWAAVRKAFERGQKILSFEEEANIALISSGAISFQASEIGELAKELKRKIER